MTVLASGDYRYRRDGRPQPISEPWSIHRDGEDRLLHGQRIVNGQPLLEVSARYRRKACTEMTLLWRDEHGQQHWHYRMDGSALFCQCDGQAGQRRTLPSASLLFPLLRAATGWLLPQIVGQPRTIVLPCLRDPQDQEHFLQPLLSTRHAEKGAKPGHYRFYGGEYGKAGSDYWLNSQGMVERYRWDSAGGVWEIALEDADYAADFAPAPASERS